MRLPFEIEAARRLHDHVFEAILLMLTKQLRITSASLNLTSWPRWQSERS